MRRLRTPLSTELLAIATDATALALPPGAYGIVPDWWNAARGAVPEFELEVWAPANLALTLAVLYGGTPHPFAPAALTPLAIELAVKSLLNLATKTTNCDTVIEAVVAGHGGDAFTIRFVQSGAVANAGALTSIGKAYTFTFKNGVTTVANFEAAIAASADLDVKTPGTAGHLLATGVDEFTVTALAGGDDTSFSSVAHGKFSGDGPFQIASTIALPAGLLPATNYWLIKEDADEFKLATSLANALGGVAVAAADVGSGVFMLSATADTQRIYWSTHDGLLGTAGDGAVTLTSQRGYRKRVAHSPRVVAYALVGTIDTGTLSAALVPIQDSET